MPQSRYRRSFGDRAEGRLIRSLTPYNKLAPFFMKKRSTASNYFSDSFEISHAERFLRRKRAEELPGIGILHLFIAAYVRTVAMRPALNRFISGQRVYSRHLIDVVVTARRSRQPEATETSIKMQFDPTDTIYDVYRRMNEKFDAVKADGGTSGTESAAAALLKFPRLILRFVIGTLKFLDYFGRLPRSFMETSPFHGSMLITDLGATFSSPMYHHLYDFGNLPLSLSFGIRRRSMEFSKEGAPVENRCMDYKLVFDGRICDGYYCTSALKLFKHFLQNPELLEQPPDNVYEDIF